MEVWPALDVDQGSVVRLIKGDFSQATRYADNPFEFIERRFDGMPPRLHLVDLSGALTGRFSLFSLVERFAARGTRIQTGGGLRSLEDIGRVVDAGAERIVLGSRLVEDTEFRQQVLAGFGRYVVAGLDVKRGRLRLSGWRKSGPPAERFWLNLREEGWQRAQVTDVDRDGTLRGVGEPFWHGWARLPGDIGAGGGIASVEDLRRLEALGLQFAVVGKAWIEGRIPVEELT